MSTRISRSNRETMVRKVTNYVRNLASRRSSGVVTADDVQAYLTRQGISARQIRTRLSFVNSVLRAPMFESTGTVYSTRPEAKGRAISAWTLA
jgi:hypothetical protein